MRKNDIGLILEGRWKVIDFVIYRKGKSNGKYVLENIYNKQQMTINEKTFDKIMSGDTTISKVIVSHIKRKGCKVGIKSFIRGRKNEKENNRVRKDTYL